LGLGALGPLVASSVINGLRWGDWSPVSYGRSVMSVGLVALGLAGAAAAAALLHFRDRLGSARQRRLVFAAALALAAASLLLPAVRELAMAWSRGLWTLLVDLSALPLERKEPGMTRTAEGSVIYFATLKKALLQSCPYFTLLLALALPSRTPPSQRKALGLLLAAAALILAFYARTSWHGGLAFNLRYLCLILPPCAIACGYILARLAEGDGRVQGAVAAAVTVAAVAAVAWLAPWRFTPDQAFLWFARAPLLLAVLVGLSTLAWLLRPRRATARACSALAGVGAAFAACAGLAYDAPRTQGLRSINYAFALHVSESIADDSLVFVQHPDPFYSLIESRERIRIAIPANDQFRDMTHLADFHLAQGRPVYAVLETSLWGSLDKARMSRRYRMQPLVQAGPYPLRRLWPLQPGTAPSASAR
jgi:hypothetical protein